MPQRRPVSARAAAVLGALVLGCSTPVGTVTGEGQVGEMPEATTLTPAAATPTAPPATGPTPSAEPAPEPSPDPTPPRPSPSHAEAADPTPVPSTPAQIARALGLDGLIELIGEDPEAAGEEGRDLLRELERVADRPEEDRIDRALERLARWEDDLDPEVAEAARVVLTDLRGSTVRPDGGRDDDHDDDDD